MMHPVLKKIDKKLAQIPSISAITDYLTGSELNSFLLEIFQARTKKITHTELLRQFDENRFVQPATVDTIQIKKLELKGLELAEEAGFSVVTLSPLVPLGSCSVVGKVDQNNVVSATRGTEIVSDATNVLALKIAAETKKRGKGLNLLQYATVHRHVRGQAFDNPAFSAHFSVFCLATGGLDTGDFAFESEQLVDHLEWHYQLLSEYFSDEQLLIKIFLKNRDSRFKSRLAEKFGEEINNGKVECIEEENPNDYYQQVQFKIYLRKQDQLIDMADGGLVDWTQKLLSNRKQRLFISGTGLELVAKLSEKLKNSVDR
ncbi:MAG: hypothetical protein ACFB15_01870 [Cyclobacteriaceae bacterium]